MEKLKTPTKFSFELENVEKMLKKRLKTKKDFIKEALLASYKRYLYKHILELERLDKEKSQTKVYTF